MVAQHYLPVGQQHHRHRQHTHNPGRSFLLDAREQLVAVWAEVDATLTPILYHQLGAIRAKKTHGTPS